MLLWLVHMCVPITPLLWSFAECSLNSNEENWTNVLEKFEQIPKVILAGQPTSGQPAYILHQIDQSNFPGASHTEPAHLQKGHKIWPQVQAGRPNLSASLREPLRGAGSTPLLPYPSCFCSNSPWIISNKILNELHRKSWNRFIESTCAKFYFIYKYLSTSEHKFRIAHRLAYWSLRYDETRLYKFRIQSLGSFYFENTKQGNSCA